VKISKSTRKDRINYLSIQGGQFVQKLKLHMSIKMVSSPYNGQLERTEIYIHIQIIKIYKAGIKVEK